VESATGIPLFYPTLFTVSELRARNLASATLAQALRAILVLNQILEHLHIDLQTRFSQRKVLELDEIDCIVGIPEQRDRPFRSNVTADSGPS
jgi:hypothetical protein